MMLDDMIAMQALGILGGLGVIFIVAAIAVKINSQRKISKCSEQTVGNVIKHRFPGDGRIVPVIEFETNGRIYRTEKKFNGCKKVRHPLPMKPDAWEDDKGYFCIVMGTIANMKKTAENLWPIGSPAQVFYSPKDPEINYVDRPIQNGFLKNTFLFSGIGLILVGIMMFFIIK